MSARLRVPHALRKMALAVAFGLAGSEAGAAIVADGKFDGLGASSYQLGFTIGFRDDKGKYIGDGKLYFGQDAGGQFLYFQMPLGFVDNTYGTNAAADWKSGHTFSDLTGSDALGNGTNFAFNGNAFKIDYIAACATSGVNSCDVNGVDGYKSAGVGTSGTGTNAGNSLPGATKNDGAIVSGSAASILEIATSLEYNLQQVDATATVNSSLNPNWIKEVGYEIQFASGTFNASDWLSPTKATTLFTLGTPHVSPPKDAKFGSYDTPQCIFGCTSTPLQGTPEPDTVWLTGAALAGLAWFSRRRRTDSTIAIRALATA